MMSQLPDSQSSPSKRAQDDQPRHRAKKKDNEREKRDNYQEEELMSSESILAMEGGALAVKKGIANDDEISTTVDDKIPLGDHRAATLRKESLTKEMEDDLTIEMNPLCFKCKRGDEIKQLVECHDCHKHYHCNCHRPAITEAELMDPRMIWYCAECSLAHKISISQPPMSSVNEPKESLKLTFCKFHSPTPLKNDKGEWVKGGWTTQIKREPLRSPAELFPSLMSITAEEPVAFQRKMTEPIRIESRRITPTGQPAGLAAWAAKLKAAKIAKKGRGKAAETAVGSTESPGQLPLGSPTEPEEANFSTVVNQTPPPVTEVVEKPKRKRLHSRLEVLLADAKHLLGDTTPNGGRRTRSMASNPIVDESSSRASISAKRKPRSIVRADSSKKQLKLTINLTEEKVSVRPNDEEDVEAGVEEGEEVAGDGDEIKLAKKEENHSGKRSKHNGDRDGDGQGFSQAAPPHILRKIPSYSEKSSDCDELMIAYQ